jgi:hypothetical protein
MDISTVVSAISDDQASLLSLAGVLAATLVAIWGMKKLARMFGWGM